MFIHFSSSLVNTLAWPLVHMLAESLVKMLVEPSVNILAETRGEHVHSVNPSPHPLLLGELRFLKIHRMGGGSRISYKNGGKGDEYCFPLMINGFCSSNALYSRSLSLAMFIFLLTPFDTLNCYYFKSNLSQVLHIKVLLIKKIM